jgi:hypothetical protein
MKRTYLANRGSLMIFCVILTAACLNYSCSRSKHYSFEIKDDMSGERVAAKVAVTDPCGGAVIIDGNPDRVEYLGKEWCYTYGSFSFTLTGDSGSLEVRVGPETLPVRISLGKGEPEKVIRLHRWTDMHEKGYMNGDIHIHMPFSESADLQMMAEDLDILNIHVGEDSVKNRQFTAKKDPASSPGRTIYVAQEVRDWKMGHLTLLGLSTMVPGYPIVGGTLESYSHTHWLMAHAMDETHRQGGLVAWSHYSNLPGAESPVAIALGKIDALELMTYDDPTQLPSHWSPWKNSGMPFAEFPVFAHTNPVYFLTDGKRVKEDASIDYLEKYVKGTVHWLKTDPQFENPADRTEALKLSENALKVYEELRK